MKCPKCGGTGFVPTNVLGVNGAIKCDFCDGTGVFITNAVEQMTNEEWLRSATTEELAEWLRGVYWHCHAIDCEQCDYPWRCMEKREIVEWLKQPHHNEVEK